MSKAHTSLVTVFTTFRKHYNLFIRAALGEWDHQTSTLYISSSLTVPCRPAKYSSTRVTIKYYSAINSTEIGRSRVRAERPRIRIVRSKFSTFLIQYIYIYVLCCKI